MMLILRCPVKHLLKHTSLTGHNNLNDFFTDALRARGRIGNDGKIRFLSNTVSIFDEGCTGTGEKLDRGSFIRVKASQITTLC
jgi:hypothetical protein